MQPLNLSAAKQLLILAKRLLGGEGKKEVLNSCEQLNKRAGTRPAPT